MAMSRTITYKGRRIVITAAKDGPKYIGTFKIEGDPVITNRGPDAMMEEEALDNAEQIAKETVDLLGEAR